MKRLCCLDIEVDWDRKQIFETVLKSGSCPIQTIQTYDSFNNKFYNFFYHPDEKPRIEKNKDYISEETGKKYHLITLWFNNEIKMLKKFMKYIYDTSPDVYTGHFIETFDLPYIINRCRNIGVPYRFFSPLMDVWVSKDRRGIPTAKIRGSIVFDFAPLYAKIMGGSRFAGSLSSLAKTHLGLDKLSHSILDEDWYENDRIKFRDYCFVDVELVLLLEEELGILDTANIMCDFSGVDPKFVTSYYKGIHTLALMRKKDYIRDILKNRYNIAISTKELHREYKKQKGATVLSAERGVIRDGLVIVMDLSRVYPNIIKGFNISVETLIDKIDDHVSKNIVYSKENDTYYDNEVIGFIPYIIDDLFRLRNKFEEERSKFDYGTKEYKERNRKRQCAKDYVNAVSGIFEYINSAFFKPKNADTIRSNGRKMFNEAIIGAQITVVVDEIERSYKVKYGDTDSIFIYIYDTEDIDLTVRISDEIRKNIIKKFDDFAKESRIENQYFNIALETINDIYLSTGVKKKYLLHTIYADGKRVDVMTIKGFELRRSDTSDITFKVQTELFDLIGDKIKKLDKKTFRKEVKKCIRKNIDLIEWDDFFLLGIPKKLGKNPNEYKKVTNPWVEGAKYANKYLGGKFIAGSIPRLIYIKDVKSTESLPSELKIDMYGIPKSRYPRTNVICVADGMIVPAGVFVVDKEMMIDRIVMNKIKDVVSLFGIDIREILTGRRKTTLDEYVS